MRGDYELTTISLEDKSQAEMLYALGDGGVVKSRTFLFLGMLGELAIGNK